MHKTLIVISILLLAVSNISLAASTPEEDQQVSPVARTTLVVRDIDTAITLFRDTLGLSIRVDLPLSGEAVSTLLGFESIEGRIVILQSGDYTIANIALMTYNNIEPQPEPKHNNRLDFGEVAVVMETSHIDELYAEIVEQGYQALTPPMVIFERPNMQTQSREFIFVGPEGIAVNLIQRGIPQPEK